MTTKSTRTAISLALGLLLTFASMWVLAGRSETLASMQAFGVQLDPSQAPGGSRPQRSSPIRSRAGIDQRTSTALHTAGNVITVCLTPGACDYDDIQDAVDAAGEGDVIKIAAGTYTGVQGRAGLIQLVYISKTVTIQGGYTTTNWTTPYPITQPTTLDAEWEGRVLVIAGSPDPPHPVIEGLHITHGSAASLGGGGQYWGQNAGGGIYVYSATATITNNWIYENCAGEGLGGGIHLYGGDSTLVGNAIYSNTAVSGGGAYLDGSSYTPGGNTPTLDDNAIFGNIAALSGGGLYLESNDAILTGNDIHHNTADYGGGLSLGAWWFLGKGSDARLSANLIHHNTGLFGGGGIDMTFSDPLLTNNVIAQNQVVDVNMSGSAIRADTSNPRLIHNTIAHNTGGNGSGVSLYAFQGLNSQAAFTNTILVSHLCAIRVTSDGAAALLNGVLWYNNAMNVNVGGGATLTVMNPYEGNPAFAADGYHLTSGSAAIDQGVATTIDDDIDGQVRPQGAGPDLGADEYAVGNIVIQKVTNPPGGTGFGFAVAADGGPPLPVELDDGESETFNNLSVGTYHVTEYDLASGFDLTGLVCTEDGTANSATDLGARHATIALDAGETVTCTFTNTQRGSIAVVKETDPAGGTSFAFSSDLGAFTLDDQESRAFPDREPGDYAITESVPGGWTLDDVTCIGGDSTPTSSGVTVHLGAGESITCTFANTQRGSIAIQKVTDPSGTAASFGFTGDLGPFDLRHGETYTRQVMPGAYAVTEQPTTTFDLTGLTCTEDGTTNSATSLGARQAAIQLEPGETVTCVFTNTQRGSIVIEKITDPPGGTDFDFSGDLGAFTLDHGQAKTFEQLVPGTYAVTEDDLPSGFDLTALVCTEDGTANSAANLGARQAAIQLDPGEAVTCTFANTQRGSIAIQKVTDPPGGTGFGFSGDLGAFTLDHQESRTFPDKEPGDYAITESVPGGWTLDDVTCIGGDSMPTASGVTVHLGAGEAITCTFSNLVSAPPSGSAADPAGLTKDVYAPKETVYAVGSGFVPNTTVDVHIVPNLTWVDGMTIPPDLSDDGMDTLSADGSGDLGPAPVWPPLLTPGEYDLVFDANRNGRYDAATDVVDDPNHPGFVVEPFEVLASPRAGATLVYTDSQGLTTVFEIPPRAVTRPISICFSPLLTPTYQLPPDVTFANHAFEFGACAQQPPLIPVGGVTFPRFASPPPEAPLRPYLPIIMRNLDGGRSMGSIDVWRDDAGGKALAAPSRRALCPAADAAILASTTFEEPVTITIHYSDDDVVGIDDEESLILLYWTGTEWADAASTCSPPSSYVRDTVNNVLQVEVCHLSQFAFGG